MKWILILIVAGNFSAIATTSIKFEGMRARESCFEAKAILENPYYVEGQGTKVKPKAYCVEDKQ